MDLSVIIVSWQVREKLRANLSALLASAGDIRFEVFVVDNASNDGSAAMVKQEFPGVRLIENAENRGFAAANNQALRLADGRFILLLNPDMRVEADTLAKVLAWAQDRPQAVVTGCKLVGPGGQIVKQVRRFPRLFDQLMIVLKIPHLFPGVVNKYLCADFDYESAAAVDSLRGAFFLINRAAYQRIKGAAQPFLDERYFIWFEEVDFCRQVREAGGEIWYTPAARCLDYVGQSFRQVRRSQGQRYFRDSMLRYFAKWEPRWQHGVLWLAWRLVGLFIS
ncbi:MAG: glycosyltransferase family 2 protein [Patescibacteria group bacterium]